MNKSLRIALAIAALLTGLGTAQAQDNLDYYWFQNSGNWNDVNNWRVLRPATETDPAAYVVPSELPDETNAVFINGVTPPSGAVPPLPVSIPASAPATVDIEVGTVGNAPLEDFPFKAKSINFGGTIPAATTVNFTVNEPLLVSNNVIAAYKAVIRSDGRLKIDGALTFSLTAAGAALIANEPTKIAGAVAVNSAVAITANDTLTMGSLSFAAPVPGPQPQLNVNQPTTVSGAVTVNSPTAITTANTFKANSLTFNNGSGLSTFTVNQRTATIEGTLAVGSNATITTGANGTLQANALNFTVTGASLTSNGTVSIANAVNVGAQTTIAVNNKFTAKSMNFTAGNSTFTIGKFTAPAIVNAEATITGAVEMSTDASITPHNGNTLTIGGNLTMSNANARLNVNGSVFLGGSLSTVAAANITTAAASIAGPAGSVTFDAAAPATIRSTAAAAARAITFDVPVTFNGNQWTLENNTILNVNRNVTFTKGYVIAPTEANMISFGPGARAINPSILSHVNGYVQKRSVNMNSEAPLNFFTFPVGSGSVYRPFVASVPSNTATTFNAKYFPINPHPTYEVKYTAPSNIMPPLTDVSKYEYWYFRRVSGSTNYRVQLSYDYSPDPNIDYYTLGRIGGLAVAGYKNDKWESMGTTINGANKTITADGAFNIVQIFTIGRNNARLPVRLVSFSAQQLDGRVQLKWQSAEEKNTSHFDVERSADGQNFAPLLTKKAQGTSAGLVSYNAVDGSPLGGTSYYRLKMVDLDGTFEYSNMVSVDAEGAVLVRPYPNPSNGREVQFLALNGDKLVLQSVMDAFGKPVGFEASPVSGQGLYVNFYGALPAGFYVATLVTDDDKRERVRIKFIVQ